MEAQTRDRIAAAAGAGLVQAALVYALVFGLAVPLPRAIGDALKTFAVLPDPPPASERIVPPRVRTRRPEGEAAPPNLRSKATEVVAPVPVVVIPVPRPIIAAPVAGIGSDASSGASDRAGPGTGAGGIGNGTGSGGRGDGDGGGYETPPRLKKGRIRGSDYPRAAAELGYSGTVSVRYRVEEDGRVSGCVITRSSGNADLDETTCRLIEQRFRYEPSRDERGQPVVSYIVHDHYWKVERVPAVVEDGRR